MPENLFRFRHFSVVQEKSPARVGTDGTLLGAWADVSGEGPILDVGTGTGLIALMAAQRNSTAKISAVESHPGAALEAKNNFANSPWSHRMKLEKIDFLDFEPQNPVKIILSNPPYFESDFLSPDQDRNAWRHVRQLTLERLLGKAKEILAPDGQISLVLPIEAGSRLEMAMQTHEFHFRRICKVKFTPRKAPKRLLMEIRQGEIQVEESEMVIQIGGRHEYSEEYIRLTRDFYPWMD